MGYLRNFLTTVFFLFSASISLFAQNSSENATKTLSIEDCIESALSNNQLIQIANYGIKIAATQKEQAKSAYYPTLDFSSNVVYLDEDPNYIFPSFNFDISGLNLGIFNLELPPITVPQQNVKLMDRFNIESNIKLVYPLYTGGKISSINDQADQNINVQKHAAEEVKAELKLNTSKAYYGFVLLNKLSEIGENSLIRLEATLELTRNLYEKGSGTVTKMDFLKNKMMVESVRGIVESVKSKRSTVKGAIKFLIGADTQFDFVAADDTLVYSTEAKSIDQLVGLMLSNNSQIKKVDAALNIFSSKTEEAESEMWPNLALFGFYKRTDNSYNYGYVTKDNKNQFGIGLGLQFPIFNGFLSTSKIDQTEIEFKKLEKERSLLIASMQMELNKLFTQYESSLRKIEAAKSAKNIAEENENLTKRAYQNDMAPIEDYLQSQIMGSLMSAQYYIAVYEYIEIKLSLDRLVYAD